MILTYLLLTGIFVFLSASLPNLANGQTKTSNTSTKKLITLI